MANYNSIHKGADIDAAVSFHKDKYREGEWTPVLKFGEASVGMTYAVQAGLYTKIGRQVTVTGYIFLSAKGTSEGNVTIDGLPFTSINVDGAMTSVSIFLTVISFADYPQAFVWKNSSSISLYEITNANVMTTLTHANFANDSEIIMSVTYFAD